MIAILSDIHSNVAALEAVLADADALGCSRIISLGDVVGYLAEPGRCIDLLWERSAVNIMGNHDGYLVDGTNCARSPTVSMITDYQRTIVTPRQLSWLAGSMDSVRDGDSLFVHGGPNDHRDQYLYKVAPSMLPPGVAKMFSGHTHVQVLARFAGAHAYCNPGSVGQPRDGDPRAAYATFDGDSVALRRVDYDIDRTAHAMKAAGFAPSLYENLYAGAQIGGRVDRVRITQDEE
jgi:predicted phosphodiesterase